MARTKISYRMLNGRVFIFKDWVSNGHWMLRFESATLPPEVQAWTDAKGDESILSEPVRATLKKQVANRTFSPEDAETPKNVIPSDANVPYSFSRRVSDADGDTHVEFTSTLEGTQPIYLANDYTKAFKILAQAVKETNCSKVDKIDQFECKSFEHQEKSDVTGQKGSLLPSRPIWLPRLDSNQRHPRYRNPSVTKRSGLSHVPTKRRDSGI